jgi:hypothetical protein
MGTGLGVDMLGLGPGDTSVLALTTVTAPLAPAATSVCTLGDTLAEAIIVVVTAEEATTSAVTSLAHPEGIITAGAEGNSFVSPRVPTVQILEGAIIGVRFPGITTCNQASRRMDMGLTSGEAITGSTKGNTSTTGITSPFTHWVRAIPSTDTRASLGSS